MDLFLFRAEMEPTIRPMRIREAKDFLVAQTAEQATLEGMPLSDLEKTNDVFHRERLRPRRSNQAER